MRETKRPLRGAALARTAFPPSPPARPPARPTKWSRPGGCRRESPAAVRPGPARPSSRPGAQSTRRPAPGPARPEAQRRPRPGGPALPEAAAGERAPDQRGVGWRGRRREETDISFELKWSRFRSDHWPKRDTNLQCSPGWLPSPIGCLVGQKMAAKEPVPARSSTSRTRPPLPPPRGRFPLSDTLPPRRPRPRPRPGHAPSRTRHAPPSPRASRAARPGKARARERARAHPPGSLSLRNLPAAGSPGNPASAPAFWRVGGEPARSGLFSLSCFFCPTCQRLARVSSARRGIYTGATLPESQGHLVFS